MRWVWPVVSGVSLGLVMSVLPLELMLLFVPFVLVAFPLIQKTRQREHFDLRIHLALPVLAAVLTIELSSELPFKYVDQTHVELNSDCVTVGELASLLSVRNTAVDATATQVCFTERSPTLRVVQRELRRQSNAEFEIGFCGNGSSFLFGASPMHQAIVAKK